MAQDEVPQQNDSPRPQDAPRPPSGGEYAPRTPTGDELALRRRVSDLEREDVAEKLREAAGEGRLSYGELEERLETVYASKTYGELVQLTADLPNGLAVPAAATAPTTHYAPNVPATAPVMTVFLSEQKRQGAWLPAQRQEVNAVLGDVTLDYTEAQLPYDEIFIEVKSILADVKIRVPQNAIVHLDSNPILGSVAEQSATFAGGPDATPGPPKVFHIHGTAILGEIKIKRGPRLTRRLGLN
ncbi:DUF1707 SHOCT-like domain-containing protein [Kribbella monticola]|uniref:DUF1707 SHOCT-like domain-containing protein n=1 Tax=Kribbella monticola TaxID=2185285 RepID=UPI000DD2BC4A|nr:DUF1707 domain-containing protein [Kribbella monticola]